MKYRKMMRKAGVLIAISMVLLFTGCQNQQSSKDTEKGNTELSGGDLQLGSEDVSDTELSSESEAESQVEKVVYTAVNDLVPGNVFEKEELDLTDLSNFFVSFKIEEGDAVYTRINGKSYQPNDDIALSELRYIKVLHYNYDGEVQVGEIIVSEKIEQDILEIFKALFEAEYQIHGMALIDDFWTGDGEETDGVSIKKNNTSAFNYRNVPGSKSRSKHALGLAIDINPYENPYVPTRNGKADYSALDETEYYYATNRNSADAHVITHEDLAYKLFTAHGFTWGGDWSSLKDYQHFVKQ